MESIPVHAVVMAGGRGERFWPLGRRRRPKQLLPLTGNVPLVEETVLRLFPRFRPENVLVITAAELVDEVRRLLPLPPENVIGEPEGRDTAPCVALACGELLRRGVPEEAVTAVLSADHLITPAVRFQEQLAAAAEFAARHEMLVTLGAPPLRAATGYGYIKSGRELEPGFFAVAGFVEKPDAETASGFVADGGYWWNCGVFVWKLATVMAAFAEFSPGLAAFAVELSRSGRPEALLAEKFPLLPRIPVDRCIMEPARNAAVAPARFQWSDLGCWSALGEFLPPDADGNRGRGRRALLDCRGNLVLSGDDHLVAAVGVNDTVIVHTPDATLVCPLASDQRLRELLRHVAAEPGGEEYL